MTKKLLTFSLVCIAFGMLTTADVFAVTYRFYGKVYYNNVAVPNVYVNLWATLTEEVEDGEVPGKEHKHFRTVTSKSGSYSFTFTEGVNWTPGSYTLWFSMDPRVISTYPQICKQYWFAKKSGNSFVSSNSKNANLQGSSGCVSGWNGDDELPDWAPESWDNSFDKFNGDPGNDGNWECKLFGRLDPRSPACY